jgi:hypothetical protein
VRYGIACLFKPANPPHTANRHSGQLLDLLELQTAVEEIFDGKKRGQEPIGAHV